MIQAQATNPNLVNRRTDSGTPHQFTKTKTGLQRMAVGYRALQTVEEQSAQLRLPTLQAWHIIKLADTCFLIHLFTSSPVLC